MVELNVNNMNHVVHRTWRIFYDYTVTEGVPFISDSNEIMSKASQILSPILLH